MDDYHVFDFIQFTQTNNKNCKIMSRHINYQFLAAFGCLSLIFVSQFAYGADSASNAASLAEISNKRVSIAVRGGASKGAYEAGANWAVIRMLRYESGHSSVLKGKFRPYEAASMTGASAGGINAILSAMEWCFRPDAEGKARSQIKDNVFRNLWFKPDINTLLPPSARSPIYRSDDAVLARKDLIETAEVLRSLWESPVFRNDCSVPLGISVTRVDPEKMEVGNISVANQRFTIPFEFRTHDDGTAGFYFNPADYPLLLDYSMILLPNESGKPRYKIDNERIIEAVFASSAFPVAFGRKRLSYCRLQAIYENGDEGQHEEDGAAQAGKLICPKGYELTEAVFADGGLFDNLPIGLARILAEESRYSKKNLLPVTYIYLDPNRLRYQVPENRRFERCFEKDPPAACKKLDYSFFSESYLLRGALGTAQNYELYRELTSDVWSFNLSQIAYQTADLLAETEPDKICAEAFPYFQADLACHSAVRYAGRLLEISYGRISAPITAPFSAKKLQSVGILKHCKGAGSDSQIPVEAECYIDFLKYRKDLSVRLQAILKEIPRKKEILSRRLRNSETSIHNDRIIRVSSRGAPITGELLESFAAFLDLKFRKYDYYVGIYDAVMEISHVVCIQHYSPRLQEKDYMSCLEAMVKELHDDLAISNEMEANYVFALLTKREFGSRSAFQFIYDPMPEKDRDMDIINEALSRYLAAEQQRSTELVKTTSGEIAFFKYLKEQGFTPTPTDDGSRPLLSEIIKDPDYWSNELARRFAERIMVLEQETAVIYAQREPDPEKRPKTNAALLGGASLALLTTTYKYSEFDFTPSTAPEKWKWRYLIPYEVAIDLANGSLQFAWQPTWLISQTSLVNARGVISLGNGLFGENSTDSRENYFSLGLGYTRLTGKRLISNYGITPGYYQYFHTQENGDIYSFGGELNFGVLGDKIRLAAGVRDFNDGRDTWYFTFGITDIPGFCYWLTR